MTLKNPLKPLTPHGERRLTVHFWILLLLAVIIFCAYGCTVTKGKHKDPCKGRRGMSGYGYGWIKCNETGKVCVLRPDGAIVYIYYDPV